MYNNCPKSGEVLLLKSYYEILGVDPACTASDIKKAFRRKAKAYHPDLKPSNRSAGMMRMLIKAYRTLSDPERRIMYDRTHRELIYRSSFDYRDFLSKRQDDPLSMAKLIFFDLLHHNESEAVELFDGLVGEQGFDLAQYLDREDFMDCAFLLAEEYEKGHEFRKAFELFRRLVDFEMDKPYFRHFFQEVIDRLKYLSCTKLPGKIRNDDLVNYLQDLVALEISPRDTAYFLKKIAEIYVEENSYDLAREYLDQGLKLHSKLPGVKKLQSQLAYTAAD
jgi:curved DNA-binding protein CbpA